MLKHSKMYSNQDKAKQHLASATSDLKMLSLPWQNASCSYLSNIEVQSDLEGLQLQHVSLQTEGCIKPGCQVHYWMTTGRMIMTSAVDSISMKAGTQAKSHQY